MSITFYYQPISQPSRAVHTLLLLGKIKFEAKLIEVLKGEQKQPEYKDIIASGTVPAIKVGDFTLFESHAILRYLATTTPSLQSFYPEDPQQQAIINCYLDWHFSNFRVPISFNYFLEAVFLVRYFGAAPAPEEKLQERLAALEEKLAFFELNFLGGEKKFKYIGNQPTLSIADLSAHAELSTLQFVNYDFSKFPVIQAYFENISQLPEVKESYAHYYGQIKEHIPELNEFNKRIIG